MKRKFNESLVQQVREGKLAVDNRLAKQTGSHHDKTRELLDYIGRNDYNGSGGFYYIIPTGEMYSAVEVTIPSRPVSDFFLPLRIEDVTDKQVIHCETEVEAKQIAALLNSNGKRMWNSKEWHTNYTFSLDNMSYDVCKGEFALTQNYRDAGYEILSASLFLQPPTEKEGKERTWTISRERLAQLAEENKGAFNKSTFVAFANKFIPVLESEKSFTEIELKNVAACHNEDFFSILFPDYKPTPHIPKGEFAWVRDVDAEEWLCRMSTGNGTFYQGQKETVHSDNWKQVRKYEDRPF